MHRYLATGSAFLLASGIWAQSGPPPSHVQDVAKVPQVFIHATVHVDARTVLNNATLVIKDGMVVAAGVKEEVPSGAVVRDMKGAHIWPALIEPYSDRGLPASTAEQRKVEEKAARHWNGALRADARAHELLAPDPERDAELREQGFGTVFTHRMDGIARGTSAALLLDDGPLQKAVMEADIAAHFSLRKGSSPDNYPNSQMGAIALVRQAILDAQWVAAQVHPEEHDPVLAALAQQLKGRLVFEAADHNEVLRWARVMDEFGLAGIIKGGGDEYARIDAIRALGRPLLIPIAFPEAVDVEDPYDALEVPLERLQQWAFAPCNAMVLDTSAVIFAFTTDGRKDLKGLWKDMRRMVACGLDSARAIEAFTVEPARLFGLDHRLGAIRPGMIANFLVTSDHLLNEKNIIRETWVRGKRFLHKDAAKRILEGTYDLNLVESIWNLEVKDNGEKLDANVRRLSGPDTARVNVRMERDGDRVSMAFAPKSDPDKLIRLSGLVHADGGIWDGQGQRPGGQWFAWSAIRKADNKRPKADKNDTTAVVHVPPGTLQYPLGGYGWSVPPEQGTVIFRHATVWTNGPDGILRDADVCIHQGRIKAVGRSLDAMLLFPGKKRPTITEIDATGKHLTAGIIDEHSHIAISKGVNEGTTAISSEVRVGDVVNPDDINVYRDLAGGVTAAQLLHGSSNPIGGQSGLIKMRWGQTADSMLIGDAPKHIKFALGENVKQSNRNVRSARFPQTRMGVEQFYYETFYRARDYETEWLKWDQFKPKQREALTPPRRDLRMEAIAEILRGERNITCHSYVQSEIDMLLHVADSMHFKVNTFTHILEGYKMAAKMQRHGVNASTFSDWWAYKFEVYDAIPYNAALLNLAGVNTGINSDDAEMGRRLNQEAAKTVKYGGVSEEEAWKMVTLNPARMLKLDQRIGSVEAGKDADIVLWSDNPLSIRARAERTYVDGACYFDLEKDAAKRAAIVSERDRLVRAMITAKKSGAPTRKPEREKQHLWHCDDLGDGLQHDDDGNF